MNIILNFKNIKNKKDILEVFEHAFKFAYPPKSFDSLIDSLSSLDTESVVYIKNKGKIHILLRYEDKFMKLFPEVYTDTIKIIKNI